jgi:hypothetical protein
LEAGAEPKGVVTVMGEVAGRGRSSRREKKASVVSCEPDEMETRKGTPESERRRGGAGSCEKRRRKGGRGGGGCRMVLGMETRKGTPEKRREGGLGG